MGTRLVVGGSGGIGAAFVKALRQRFPEDDILYTTRKPDSQDSAALYFDYDQPESMDLLINRIKENRSALVQVIVATGLLHQNDTGPEKTFRNLSPDFLQRVMWVNAHGPILLLSRLLTELERNSVTQIGVLSARVGSIEDNQLGGWYSYRASKAALNQLLKTLAIELKRTHKGVQILSLHPGTTDTQLSKPFQARVPEHKLFSPDFAAGALLDVMASYSDKESGLFLDWDGQPIPW